VLAYCATGGTSSFGGATSTGSTGLFGQTNTTQQQPATSLFGQNQPTGNAFGGGAFGAQVHCPECVTTNASRLGSNTTGQKPSMFGQTAQQQPATGSGFGLFGSQQQQNPQGQQGTTGLFGGQPAFGQTNPTQTGQPQQGGCKLCFMVSCPDTYQSQT
jgi:Nucleoporin FG repeat region